MAVDRRDGPRLAVAVEQPETRLELWWRHGLPVLAALLIVMFTFAVRVAFFEWEPRGDWIRALMLTYGWAATGVFLATLLFGILPGMVAAMFGFALSIYAFEEPFTIFDVAGVADVVAGLLSLCVVWFTGIVAASIGELMKDGDR